MVAIPGFRAPLGGSAPGQGELHAPAFRSPAESSLHLTADGWLMADG